MVLLVGLFFPLSPAFCKNSALTRRGRLSPETPPADRPAHAGVPHTCHNEALEGLIALYLQPMEVALTVGEEFPW